MKYLEYRERRQQGTFNFPIAFYHIEPTHPRYHMPYHWHPECEVIRIIRGDFLLTINDKNYLLKCGDIAFIQDGMLHGGMPEDCVYECVVFDMKLLLKDNHICRPQLENLMSHTTLIHSLLPATLDTLVQTVDALFTAMKEKRTGYEFMVQGSLYFLIGLILEHQLYEHTKNGPHMRARLTQIKQVLSFIEAHYTEPISLEDMAAVAGMNAKYFCRIFKEMTQMTPVSYLNYYRIECASEQLSTTDISITEAALSCGFNDISYFIKTFKKQMGITPKQYVKQKY